ncbi:hypothetical protein NDU88_005922 [Pleurodeles waltl]|uniref:Uncharacterized protein n=1 Tax=Pleurodeles waltl TaxID=8319 RepID=A0AAV7W958_PLEWA|nr:hypothetical protein NDU88_005922 [Pleurodeles waltl]
MVDGRRVTQGTHAEDGRRLKEKKSVAWLQEEGDSGHTISSEGTSPKPDLDESTVNAPEPNNAKQLE